MSSARARPGVEAELAELRAELERRATSKPPTAPAEERRTAEPSEDQAQLQQLLHELQSVLGDAAQGAEGVIVEHPLASVSAAFLLGLAVGWRAARS